MKEHDEKVIQSVYDTIRECLNEKDLHIELSSNLADLDIDSSDGYCLIMELEEIYGIVIDDKIIETFTTVESVVVYVEKLLESA